MAEITENNLGDNPGINNGTFQPAPQDIIEPVTELQRAQEMLSEIPELTDEEINAHKCDAESKVSVDLTIALGSQVILHPDSCFDGSILPFGWECSNPEVVLVNPTQSLSEALIMGMSEGDAVVKASTTLGTIPEREVTWNVTVAGGGNNPTPEPEPEEGEKPTIKNEIVGDPVEGNTVDSSVSFTPGDYAGTMVYVKGTVTPANALSIQYEEGGQYKPLPIDESGVFYYGVPTIGFPMSEATSKFKTTYNTSGKVTLKLEVIAVDGGEVLATDEITNEVAAKPKTEEEYAQEITGELEGGGEIKMELNQKYTPAKVIIPVAGTKLEMDFGGQEAIQLTGQDFLDLTKGVTATLSGGSIIEELPPQDKAEAAIYMSGAKVNTLTLEDMTIKAARGVYVNNVNSTATIKSGRYEVLYNSTPAVYVACGSSASDSGKVVIEGGTFGTSGVNNKYLLNILDKLNKVEGKTPRDFIEVRGGTFYNFNPAESKSENPEANFVAEGYEVQVEETGEDKIYTVVPKKN